MAAKKTHWLRNTIIILLIFGIAGLALTAVRFFGNAESTAATATLVFTFEGAADGIAPNGAMFNISDITSEDVITAGLEASALAEKYTVDQIKSSLIARGVYPSDMVSRVMSYESLLDFDANREATSATYHPTTFTIELYNDFDKTIPKDQLTGLLKAIVEAYKAHFAKVYANSLLESGLPATLSDYDYPQQLDIIENRFQTTADYAQEMYLRRPSFLYEGMGFNDITVRLSSLISIEINRLRADMTMNALTRDIERLKSRYAFEINDISNFMENQNTHLDRLDKLIAAYEKNAIIYLSSGNNVTKIDSNASVTYDTLVSQLESISQSITDANSRIITYRQMLSDLTGEAEEDVYSEIPEGETVEAPIEISQPVPRTLTEAQRAALEARIDAIVSKGDAVVDDFQSMLKAFNAQEINDLTVTVIRVSYNSPSVFSGAFVKLALQTAGPLCAIGFMLCMVLIIISRKREQKA